MRRFIVAAALSMAGALPLRTQTQMLDDFETLAGWSAQPSDGVTLAIRSDAGHRGRAMRLDFDFHGGGGYAVVHKTFAIDLPENYEFTTWLRGDAPVNNLEFKLADSTGDNVWWKNHRDFQFPAAWTKVTIKRRQIEFAWGPLGGGAMKHVAAIEFAITAGQGGKGSVWLDDLAISPLEPVIPDSVAPRAVASSSGGRGAANAIDGDTSTRWVAGPGDQWLAVDFKRIREYGGIVVDWAPPPSPSGAHASSYHIQTSRDGKRWDTVHRVQNGNGGRDYIYIPETESRYLRLLFNRDARSPGRRYAIREVSVQPLDWSSSANAFFRAVARDAPRGSYPKYLSDEQSYWTVVGVPGSVHEALINEEGMIETGKSEFSIEPFLRIGDRFLTWNDVTRSQRLERDDLPIPSVEWAAGDVTLLVTAWASGSPDRSSLFARYRVRNNATRRVAATLLLALRPFQVNPSWQSLNTPGGTARIRTLDFDGSQVRVNGERTVVSLVRPERFAAATFEEGNVAELLREGRFPSRIRATDRSGWASGVLSYRLDLDAGASRDVYIEIPFPNDSGRGGIQRRFASDSAARVYAEQSLEQNIRDWSAQLGRVSIELPARAAAITRTLRTTIAYILVNRDGPAIQPGSRSYERSWIRDGSLTSAALLRMGHPAEVREFIEWYAPFQYPSGKVPCCVDRRGADPVPEHDSHGQLIYVIAEYYRYTRDRAFLERMWPHVLSAARHIDSLRHERMTPEYETAEKRVFFGLLPQSISHEGYSAKPMHSYWDDFFALKGLKDAAEVAGILGHDEDRLRLAASRDEFRRHLNASFRAALSLHNIDYLPGAADLGDFDATSTTVGIAPGGELHNLPQPALRRTFERYYDESIARRAGTKSWDAFTPYELRTVGTFVQLGWKTRAHELLDFFLSHRRPAAWNGWAEVVWRDPAAPKFIGDMPHTWVGSDFIRSVLDMFAYERDEDSALVVGAGIPEEWVTADPGVVIRGLPTIHGPLTFSMLRNGGGSEVRVQLSGDMRIPVGGIAVRSPMTQPVREAVIDGVSAPVSRDGAVVVRRLPADVRFRY